MLARLAALIVFTGGVFFALILIVLTGDVLFTCPTVVLFRLTGLALFHGLGRRSLGRLRAARRVCSA